MRSRLSVLWALSLATSLAVAFLLWGLYRQSSTAQLTRAEDAAAAACDAIADRFSYYATGWAGPLPDEDQARLHADLAAILTLALPPAISGGLWTPDGLLAANAAIPQQILDALPTAEDRITNLDAGGATLILQACPLPGPIPNLTGFTLLRVETAPGQYRAVGAVALLLALAVAMTALLTSLVTGWRRRIASIETALAAHEAGALPRLAATGEPELDRIVAALNTAGARLAAARQEQETLNARVADAERLASLGRLTAGVAHEVRNPLAAMRLKAENALAGDDTRQKPALTAILTQIARLDRLIAELLAMTQRRTSTPVPTPLKPFLQTCIADYRTITIETPDTTVTVDPDLLRRALDSLLQNAAHHTPPAGTITLRATTTPTTLHLEIADTGPGVSENLKKTLFDPFVTGRSDGTGLGLAIARELIQAMHGIITLAPTTPGATFLIDLPCPPS